MGAFEDRLGCPYCRDPDRLASNVLDVQWRIHDADHVIDKLEPAPWPRDIDPSPPGSTFEETFKGIFQEAFDLLVERQRKYGPENIRSLGLWGTFERLSSDKIERVRRAFDGTLRHGRLETWVDDDFGDDSFEDSLLDIANYAFIMLALRRGAWGRPLQEDIDAS